MNPLSRLLAAAALSAAALGIAPAAVAQSSATVYFDNFAYQLADLNPDDGQEPGIAFYASSGSITGQASFYDAPDGTGAPRDSVSSSNPFGRISLSISAPDVGIAGEATQTSGNVVINLGHGSGNISTESIDAFVLNPYTEITFSIYGNVGEYNSPGNNSYGNLTMTGRLFDANGGVVEYNSYLFSNGGSASDILLVTLRSGAASLPGQIEFRTEAFAQVLAPVPEPATAVMLAAGLALFGLQARRRRRAGISAA